MDESPMNHAFDAAEFAGGNPGPNASPGTAARLAEFPWRNYTRCLVLALVLGVVGYIAFRPGLLRFSILMSLVSPSRGESLAWKPDEEEDFRLAPVRYTSPPDEWRLAATHTAGWSGTRPDARADAWQGGRLGASKWQRNSYNPWSWSDDVARARRRNDDPNNGPGQKPASSFRVKEAGDWSLAASAGDAAPQTSAFASAGPERVPSVAPLASTAAPSADPADAGSGALSLFREAAEIASRPSAIPETPAATSRIPALAPLNSLPPALQPPPLPSSRPTETAAAPLSLPERSERIVSEAISLDDLPVLGVPEPARTAPVTQPPALRPPETIAAPTAPATTAPAATATLSPAEALSATIASAVRRETPQAPAPSSTPPPAPPAAPSDWKDREITGPIPGAYLTIYPKLKFIGLCVPGQGYIRKYNQIAVPMDLAQPKQHAADGRTPYGKYYVAAHVRDASGPRVVLSWPAVDDARRGGVGPEMIAEIERAWRQQAMPPQNSLAGGNLALSGDRDRVEYTSGGFSLEAPHMEEIFTALPDGAWVFVQQ